MRLDPFALPARFEMPVAEPASASRSSGRAAVYLDRDRAIVRRRLGGLPLTLSVAIRAFKGVAVRTEPNGNHGAVTVSLELLHHDPALTLPLLVADHFDDVLADWRAWARTLGLPLIFIESDGRIMQPEERLGAVAVGDPIARRKSPIPRRRPRFLKRRKVGRKGEMPVYEEAREIIART
ncbi:MAG: hypothetical protein C0606_15830 [Hyphomicrobiales bacterium]|nr:MAG: hypothetical protein C0606_15830 [Hyphomicrobiales bacterium]